MKKPGLALSCALAPAFLGLALTTGCGGGPTTGGISGNVTYSGPETGSHVLAVALYETLGGAAAGLCAYLADENDLASGVAYVLSNIPAGDYYLVAWWDAITDGDGPTSGEPYTFIYPFTITAGQDTTQDLVLDSVVPP